MDRIVFINQWASHLTKDIINAYAKEYKQVALIAGTITETGNPLDPKVKLHRIVKYNRTSIFKRKLTWILATIQTIFLVKTRFRNYHLFITTNPPTLSYVTLFCKNSYSVQILDIFPDALVVAGFISKESNLNRIWENHNRKYFAGAEHIFTLTDGMARTISKYCDPGKIKVIAQWSSSNGNCYIERNKNEFIRLHSLENYFIVMYSGNIGLGHHVATLVETARILRDNKDILFLIIGEGWNKPLIERLIDDYGLKNCLVLPFQSPDMFKHSIQAADLGVVSVSKELAPICVPIKTYNLIYNEIPLIFITEGQSELASLANKYDVGKCFTPTQYSEIGEFILSLKSDKDALSRYKQNLKNCADKFTSKNALVYVKSMTL
jgi:glycosyltransferase involved in cell wall biosynthesis